MDISSDSFYGNAVDADPDIKSDKNSYLNYGKKLKENKSPSQTEPDDESEPEIKIEIGEEQLYRETISNYYIKGKRVMLEPKDDIDVPKKKKKIGQIEIIDNQNESQDCDETGLPVKVKQEEPFASSSSNPEQKKRKQQSNIDFITSAKSNSEEGYINNSSSDSYDGMVTVKQESEDETENEIQYDSDDHSIEMDVKMDIGETVVNKPEQSNENNTFEEEDSEDTEDSEESGADEINKATNRSKPPITDRIRFEDEEDTNIESSQRKSVTKSSKKSSKLKNYAKANPNLKLLTHKFYSNPNLTSNDEIWILKFPKDVDIKEFNNKSLKIHGNSKIEVNGRIYDGSAEDKETGKIHTMLTMEHSKFQMCDLPLNGIINLRSSEQVNPPIKIETIVKIESEL